jgi:hypothetical protein
LEIKLKKNRNQTIKSNKGGQNQVMYLIDCRNLLIKILMKIKFKVELLAYPRKKDQKNRLKLKKHFKINQQYQADPQPN